MKQKFYITCAKLDAQHTFAGPFYSEQKAHDFAQKYPQEYQNYRIIGEREYRKRVFVMYLDATPDMDVDQVRYAVMELEKLYGQQDEQGASLDYSRGDLHELYPANFAAEGK